MKAWSRSQYERHPYESEILSTYLSASHPYGVPIPPPSLPIEDSSPLPPPRISSGLPKGKGKRSRHVGRSETHSDPRSSSIKISEALKTIDSSTFPKGSRDDFSLSHRRDLTKSYLSGKECKDLEISSYSKSRSRAKDVESIHGPEVVFSYSKGFGKQQQQQQQQQLELQQQHQQMQLHHHQQQLQQSGPDFKNWSKEKEGSCCYLESIDVTGNSVLENEENEEREPDVKYAQIRRKEGKNDDAVACQMAVSEQRLSREKSPSRSKVPTFVTSAVNDDYNDEYKAESCPLSTFTSKVSQLTSKSETGESVATPVVEYSEVRKAGVSDATLKRKSKSSSTSNTTTMTTTTTNHNTKETKDNFSTLERNMAEVAAQQLRDSVTLDRRRLRSSGTSGNLEPSSCETCDAPLTPASLAGMDPRELEHRPLTRSVTRATVYDEPPDKTSLFITISAFYGLLLVVICVAFLTSEVVTHHVPLHYFEGFFTYLYLLSILFLLYIFCFILHESNCCGPETSVGRPTYFHNLPRDALPDGSPIREKMASLAKPRKHKTSENDHSHGSFFLRVGGIGFGLGTMIYNGLELGTFFEIPWNSPCYQVLRGINPILQMVFSFSQMYFVFMNARLNIHKFKCVARFGLMHVVITNICVWIRTFMKECTKDIARYRVLHKLGVSEDYMILEGYNSLKRKFGDESFFVNGPYAAILSALSHGRSVGQGGLSLSHNPFSFFSLSSDNVPSSSSSLISGPVTSSYIYAAATTMSPSVDPTRIIKLANNFTCGRQAIMGNIVMYSTPYLYPFLIQYSLIAASVLYVMWRNVGRNPRYVGEDEDHISVASKKMTNYAKTDCIGASKGLFFGLLTLVVGMICLILFFVLIDHENKQVSQLAVFLADLSHVTILVLAILATLLGFIRVTKLKFHGESSSLLGDYLLRIASVGIFAYGIFNVIAGGLGDYTDLKNILVFGTGGVTIVQVLFQLLFITDAQRRRIHSLTHDNVKPGRQVITFLLICNLTMWLIFTFEVQKVQDNPVQLNFYGFYAWTIIQRLTLPLCIFFRFHSTVLLTEIWKNSYKAKLID